MTPRDEMIGDDGRSADDDALDAIAAACGCPQWEYPGQVVRDVQALARMLETARAENAVLRDDLTATRRQRDECGDALVKVTGAVAVQRSIRKNAERALSSSWFDESNRKAREISRLHTKLRALGLAYKRLRIESDAWHRDRLG